MPGTEFVVDVHLFWLHGPIDVRDHTGAKRRRADEIEIDRFLQSRKQGQATPQSHGMNQQAVFVDKPKLRQALGESPATVSQDILARLMFEARDFDREIPPATLASSHVVALGDRAGNGLRPFAAIASVALTTYAGGMSAGGKLLVDGVPRSTNVRYYGEIVRDKKATNRLQF